MRAQALGKRRCRSLIADIVIFHPLYSAAVRALKPDAVSPSLLRMRGVVAFDLDGVLYSSEPFLGAVYRETIASVNERHPGTFARVPSTREILNHVGWPLTVILRRLFPVVDSQAIDWLYHESLPVICRYVAAGKGILFPGARETLLELSAQDRKLVIASNGRRRYIETVLITYALDALFDPLITVEDLPGAAKGEVLQNYLARYAISADALVMVGDRASDVDAARAVGCRFVGCDYGHGYRHEIEAFGPTIATIADLPRCVADILDSPRENSR